MDISIIIPSFNTKELLDRCLRSIAGSLKDSSLRYEIIVVDNASTDGSKEMLNKKYTRVIKIYNNKNIGYGKSNNQGIRKAKGKHILLLNSDIKVQDQAIDSLYEYSSSNPSSFIGGKLLNEDNSPQPSCGPSYNLLTVFFMLFAKGDVLHLTRNSPESVQQVAWVSGACLMGAKKSFVDVGLFDEDIFMYMDEIDFLYRASKKGYTTIFYPEARFIHTGAASSGNRKQPVLNIYRGLVYFYSKHFSAWQLLVLKILLTMKAYTAILIGKIVGRSLMVSTYEEALRVVFT